MNLGDMIDSTRGRIFRAEFVKRDGTLRKMVARTGVKRNLRGVGLRYDPRPLGLRTVWDIQKGDYRTVNTATLVSFKCGKINYSQLVK